MSRSFSYFFCDRPSDAIVCNDTRNWINSHNYNCSGYGSNQTYCVNGQFQWGAHWAGGDKYRYPELNCCDCGKGKIKNFQIIFFHKIFSISTGWPVWFVPKTGYSAVKAIPKLTISNESSNITNLQCVDPLGNSDVCNMTCEAWTDPIISLTNITDNNFDSFNCTLTLQTTNVSMLYVLQIPQDNYLVYFTNWTTDNYNFSCSGAILPSNSSMVCRRAMAECLPSTTTYRCVSSGMYSPIYHYNLNAIVFI